jgi:hypothetical protein
MMGKGMSLPPQLPPAQLLNQIQQGFTLNKTSAPVKHEQGGRASMLESIQKGVSLKAVTERPVPPPVASEVGSRGAFLESIRTGVALKPVEKASGSPTTVKTGNDILDAIATEMEKRRASIAVDNDDSSDDDNSWDDD